jgi:hypothetical protein
MPRSAQTQSPCSVVLDKTLTRPRKRLASVAAMGLELHSCDAEKCRRGCLYGLYIGGKDQGGAEGGGGLRSCSPTESRSHT